MRVFGVELWCMRPNRYLIIDCIIFAVVVAVCVPVFAAVPASRVYTGILLGVAVIFVLKLWRFLPSHQRWLEHEAGVLADKLVAERRAVRPPTRLPWVVPGEAVTPPHSVPLYYPCPYPSPPPAAPPSHYPAARHAVGMAAAPCTASYPVARAPLTDLAGPRAAPRPVPALPPPPPPSAPNTPPTHAALLSAPTPRLPWDAARPAGNVAPRLSLASPPPRVSPYASTASRAALSVADGAGDVWGTFSRTPSRPAAARAMPAATPYTSTMGDSVAASLPASHGAADEPYYGTGTASVRAVSGVGAPLRPGASTAGSVFASQGGGGVSWGGRGSPSRGGVGRVPSGSCTSSPTYSHSRERPLWMGQPSLPASRSPSPAPAGASSGYRYAY